MAQAAADMEVGGGDRVGAIFLAAPAGAAGLKNPDAMATIKMRRRATVI